jgi:hypothetical protein
VKRLAIALLVEVADEDAGDPTVAMDALDEFLQHADFRTLRVDVHPDPAAIFTDEQLLGADGDDVGDLLAERHCSVPGSHHCPTTIHDHDGPDVLIWDDVRFYWSDLGWVTVPTDEEV